MEIKFDPSELRARAETMAQPLESLRERLYLAISKYDYSGKKNVVNEYGKSRTPLVEKARRDALRGTPSVSRSFYGGPPQGSSSGPLLPPPSDNLTGGRPVMGGSGGFTAAQQGVKYTVERMVPPDGLLGTHYGFFSIEELGQTYGEGTYKITKHEPGRAVPIEYTQKIGSTYGRPRFQASDSRKSSMMVPKNIIQKAVVVRLAECGNVISSAAMEIKKKNFDASALRGKVDFLMSVAKHVDSLLAQL